MQRYWARRNETALWSNKKSWMQSKCFASSSFSVCQLFGFGPVARAGSRLIDEFANIGQIPFQPTQPHTGP